jgi:hypothetical protein
VFLEVQPFHRKSRFVELITVSFPENYPGTDKYYGTGILFNWQTFQLNLHTLFYNVLPGNELPIEYR